MSPRLPSLSTREIIRALRKAGFKDAPERGKGSHRALMKSAGDRVWLVIVPKSRDIPRGTMQAILEQAGMTVEEFRKLL